MMRFPLAAAAFAAALAASSAEAQTAVLRGLDKITGHARDFGAPIGRTVKFGTLEITARACRQSSPEEAPETSVYVEIVDVPLRPVEGRERVTLMNGWMFASSPAINALEHPTYDVWAISCRA